MTRAALRAVIFDVDGTLAETERDGHRPAFNRAFADLGLPYHWDVAQYGELLAITGGRSRLRHYLAAQGFDGDLEAVPARLHELKTAHFVEWVRAGPLTARPGVEQLIRDLHGAGITVAVATTGSRAWVEPLLAGLFPGIPLAPVVTGNDVQRLKPAPDAYLLALDLLGRPAQECLAIEDSPPGVAAAAAAGLRCVAVTSAYTRELAFPVAPTIRLDDYSGLSVADLMAGWPAAAPV